MKHLMTGPKGNSEFCFPEPLCSPLFISSLLILYELIDKSVFFYNVIILSVTGSQLNDIFLLIISAFRMLIEEQLFRSGISVKTSLNLDQP